MNNINITGITLLASSVCNLSCSYCYINKTNNDSNEEIKINLKSGKYFENIKTTLDSQNCDCKKIEFLEL